MGQASIAITKSFVVSVMKIYEATVSQNLHKSILKRPLTPEEIQTYTENMLAEVMKETKGIEISVPFPRMSYDEAMARYGSDKPDTRFAMELIDVAEVVKDVDFKVFQAALENGGHVKALNAKRRRR